MRKTFKAIAVMAVVLLCAGGAMAVDLITPSYVTFTNFRNEAVQSVSWAGQQYKGAWLIMTNCKAYSTTGTNTVQGLSSVTVTVEVGTSSTNATYWATNQDDAAGTFFAWVRIPTTSTFQAHVKLTDSAGGTYIYPAKSFTTLTPFE